MSITLVAITSEIIIKILVANTIIVAKPGITPKNLNNPGACAIPTAINTFLKLELVFVSGINFTPMKHEVTFALNAVGKDEKNVTKQIIKDGCIHLIARLR